MHCHYDTTFVAQVLCFKLVPGLIMAMLLGIYPRIVSQLLSHRRHSVNFRINVLCGVDPQSFHGPSAPLGSVSPWTPSCL